MSHLEEVSTDELMDKIVDNPPTFTYSSSDTSLKQTNNYQYGGADNDDKEETDNVVIDEEDEDEDEENKIVDINEYDDNDVSDDDAVSDDDDVSDIEYDDDGNLVETNDTTVNKPNKGSKTKKNVSSTTTLLDSVYNNTDENDDESDEGDESDEDDDNYLQKFDTNIRNNFIQDSHPDKKTHNYEEVRSLSRIIKNDSGFITNDYLHKTLPFLTKYEMTRVLGQRAKQINSGAKPFVKVPENIIDGYLIAKMELENKKIPFIIKRPLPDGTSEYWRVSDLELM